MDCKAECGTVLSGAGSVLSGIAAILAVIVGGCAAKQYITTLNANVNTNQNTNHNSNTTNINFPKTCETYQQLKDVESNPNAVDEVLKSIPSEPKIENGEAQFFLPANVKEKLVYQMPKDQEKRTELLQQLFNKSFKASKGWGKDSWGNVEWDEHPIPKEKRE